MILKSSSGPVYYWPPFEDPEELANHFFRAAWYLAPQVNGRPMRVILFRTFNKETEISREPHFGDFPVRRNLVTSAVHSNFSFHPSGGTVLVHKNWQAISRNAMPGQVLNVASNDLTSKEYGTYSSLCWKLTAKDLRAELLENWKQRLYRLIERLKRKSQAPLFEGTIVCGTGPSLSKLNGKDLRNWTVIASNSIVGNKELLESIRPEVIVAGDSVSHAGCSAYAQKFRSDLRAYLIRNPRAHFVTVAKHALLFEESMPDVAERIIGIDQRGGPVADLRKEFRLPALDGASNVFLYPIASSISDNFLAVGLDGKDPDSSRNEDFWGHESESQYQALVYSGHKVSPTFDVHRQSETWQRHQRDTQVSIDFLRRKGIKIRLLSPSNIEALASYANVVVL